MIENIPPLLLRKLWILNLFCKTHHTPPPHTQFAKHTLPCSYPPPLHPSVYTRTWIKRLQCTLGVCGVPLQFPNLKWPKIPQILLAHFPHFTHFLCTVQHVKRNFMFLSSSIRVSPPLNKSNLKKISEESHQISSSNMRQNKVFCGLEFFRFEMLKVTKQPSQHN